MESNSQPASCSDRAPQQTVANVVGTAIAVLTLTLPLFAIAHYSSSNIKNGQPLPYSEPKISSVNGN
ncbi:MAG TPA: hypothetical protein VK211_11265 [Kamptonema sp.]|nr:hypothetical protein [Kamptonema sp.]